MERNFIEKSETPVLGDNKLKLVAIKLQIRFRQKVIWQKIPDKMGNFSAAGKPFSLEQMIQRVKSIVTQI